MSVTIPKHPAPFSDPLFPVFVDAIDAYAPKVQPLRILDPFAGIGRVHRLQDERMIGTDVVTTGVELLPGYAHAHDRTRVGDATKLPRTWSGRFDAVVTSPCYGNRMADHHVNADACKACRGSGEVEPDGAPTSGTTTAVACKKCNGSGVSPRRSYRHWYGGPDDEFFVPNNAGALQWGPEYKHLHEAAWSEVHRVLVPGGIFILNVKDFIRDRRTVRVTSWHRRTCERLGFERLCTYTVPLPGARFGENHEARVDHEFVYVFEKAA